MASLSSSTAAIVDAWLRGSVSGTYTSTALEQMLMMVEADRAALTASPKLLIDPRGAMLADSAARFSQRIAAILSAVQRADSATVRAEVAAIPFQRAS
jgi:hypothetical protein